MNKTEFIPGLQLNEMFYHEAVKPILKKDFASLIYSAALIGYGSDVLGFDNTTSMDHNWGPRMSLFLSPEDCEKYKDKIDECLRQKLPHTFRGLAVDFSQPDLSDGGTQRMQANDAGPVNHLIRIGTIEMFFESYLGKDPRAGIKPIDWLTFSEQALLEVTRGKVFHDGLELEKIRAQLAYYPKEVWLYRMAAEWKRISQEEPFVGRCGNVGDELGSRVIAARLVRDLMRLGFLIERKYAPYSKWLGTAFARLESSPRLSPIFNRVLAAPTWQTRQENLCDAYVVLAEMHNALGITRHVEPTVTNFFGRPYRVIFADRFVKALLDASTDEEIKNIDTLIGGVDQFSDSTDLIDDTRLCRKAHVLYE